MIERLATKILGLIDDVRMTRQDIDYLAWQIVYQSPKPMRKRVLILAESITYHHEQEQAAADEQYTLF